MQQRRSLEGQQHPLGDDVDSVQRGFESADARGQRRQSRSLSSPMGRPGAELYGGSTVASQTFTSDQLARGLNLADAFPNNPFSEAFARVDAAVSAKQAYETKEIKQLFRSPEAKTDMEGVAARGEKEREPLAKAIADAFVPVTHRISITPN